MKIYLLNAFCCYRYSAGEDSKRKEAAQFVASTVNVKNQSKQVFEIIMKFQKLKIHYNKYWHFKNRLLCKTQKKGV